MAEAMTARPNQHDVITKSARRVQSAVAAMLGGVLVMLLNHIPEPVAATIDESPFVSACKLPSQNGEMTVFIVEDGKMKCWRWK